MKLLTFAHRGEAQAFLTNSDYKPVSFFFDGLFKNADHYLLITGEGAQAASEKTMATLSSFHQDIDQVINLGVAGSLNEKCKIYDLFWIRTSYAHHAERLEFKSFTSATSQSMTKFDCMTAYTRVLDPVERTKLAAFANIVDRELWAIASAAQFFKIPYQALKIISDDLTFKSPDTKDICKFVKDEAPLLSEKLFREFQNRETQTKKELTPSGNIFLDNPAFYFTTSQGRKLFSLSEGLKLKGHRLHDINIDEILVLEIMPKDRTRLLLIYLNDLLNPMAKKVRQAIDKTISPLIDAGISTNMDNELEADWIQLTLKIQSSRDLEKAKNALKIFSYEDFKSVFNGELGEIE